MEAKRKSFLVFYSFVATVILFFFISPGLNLCWPNSSLPEKSSYAAYKSGTERKNYFQEQKPEVQETRGFPLVQAWRLEAPGKFKGLEVVGNHLFWTSEEGKVYLVDSSSGAVIKVIDLGEELISPPVASAGKIWLLSPDKLFCLEEKGEIKLKLDPGENLISWPLVNSNQLFLLFSGGKLEAIDASSGEKLWQRKWPAALIPVSVHSASSIFVALDSGQLLELGKENGETIAAYQFPEPVTSLCEMEDKILFLALKSGQIVSLDWKKLKRRWQVNFGSQQIFWMGVQNRRLYLLSSNGILLALKASTGDLIWWTSIPGRIFFRPLFLADELFLAASGQKITGFDLKTGKVTSEIQLPEEITTELRKVGEKIIVGSYNYRQNQSCLYALKKEPQIFIDPSPPPPQPAGTRITFTVRAAGFKRPEYEFSLRAEDGQEKVVQKNSTRNTWIWYPVRAGNYVVAVKVSDKKLTRKAELSYNITQFIKENEERKE